MEMSLVPFHVIPALRNVKMMIIGKVYLKERLMIVSMLRQPM